jgi:hypothetical protein
MTDISPEFKAKVDAALAPLEELIETMWEQFDEIAKRDDPDDD